MQDDEVKVTGASLSPAKKAVSSSFKQVLAPHSPPRALSHRHGSDDDLIKFEGVPAGYQVKVP